MVHSWVPIYARGVHWVSGYCVERSSSFTTDSVNHYCMDLVCAQEHCGAGRQKVKSILLKMTVSIFSLKEPNLLFIRGCIFFNVAVMYRFDFSLGCLSDITNVPTMTCGSLCHSLSSLLFFFFFSEMASLSWFITSI